jgi:probable HAF family extracellular repeat protein
MIVAGGAFPLLSAYPAAAQEYSIIDLGLLPTDQYTEAYAVNARRQVAGSTFTVPLRAFYWDRHGIQEIGPLGGTKSRAFDINNRGEVVGVATLPGDQIGHAFVWRDGVLEDLGTLPGGTVSIGYAINQRGQVVGTADASDGSVHAFLWHRGTGMFDLGPLSLGGDPAETMPHAMNNRGQVVGEAENAGGDLHGFLWDGGLMNDLGTLGGSRSFASDINQRGEIVGASKIADDTSYYACRWNDGQIELLATLGSYGEARAINSRGEIVGWSRAPDAYHYAVLWRDEALYNLNDLIEPDLGWLLVAANDINDGGDIVGFGYLNDEGHAFLLTPRMHAAAALAAP